MQNKTTAEKISRRDRSSAYVIKDGLLTLKFIDTKAKLTLIDMLHEQIKYPKKNYNVITDDDDYYSEDDMMWDKLHKHGL